MWSRHRCRPRGREVHALKLARAGPQDGASLCHATSPHAHAQSPVDSCAAASASGVRNTHVPTHTSQPRVFESEHKKHASTCQAPHLFPVLSHQNGLVGDLEVALGPSEHVDQMVPLRFVPDSIAMDGIKVQRAIWVTSSSNLGAASQRVQGGER